uniref:Polyprotein n=1 Tax=Ivyscoutvirus sp. TaxID=3163429 RepID=A0AAU7SRW3_9VIRU
MFVVIALIWPCWLMLVIACVQISLVSLVTMAVFSLPTCLFGTGEISLPRSHIHHEKAAASPLRTARTVKSKAKDRVRLPNYGLAPAHARFRTLPASDRTVGSQNIVEDPVVTPSRLPTLQEVLESRNRDLISLLNYLVELRCKGVFFYKHFTHTEGHPIPHLTNDQCEMIEPFACSLEPFSVLPEERYAVWDPNEHLWCGDSINSFPVTARKGPWASIGCGANSQHPDFWVPAATKKSAEPGSSTPQIVKLQPGTELVVVSRGSKQRGFQQKKKKKQKSPDAPLTPVGPPSIVNPIPTLKKAAQAVVKPDGTVPPVNTGLDELMKVALPSRARRPNDPRNKAKNLGKVVDGTLGWGVDVLEKVPIVGGMLGGVGEAAAGIVRAAEDVANVPTSMVGLKLFIVCIILHLICPCGATPPASHWCRQTKRLSNACDPTRDILFCTAELCWNAVGCVPCENGSCWFVRYQGVSSAKQDTKLYVTARLALNTLAAAIVGCDIMGVGELCSLVLVTADYSRRYISDFSRFSCNCSCWETDVPGWGLKAEFQIASEAFSVLTGHLWDVFLFLTKIPFAIFKLATFAYPIISAAVIIYFVTGQYIKTAMFVMLLMLAGEGDAWWWSRPTFEEKLDLAVHTLDNTSLLYDGPCAIRWLNQTCTNNVILEADNKTWPRLCQEYVKITAPWPVLVMCLNSVIVLKQQCNNCTIDLSRVRDSCTILVVDENKVEHSSEYFLANCLHDNRPKECVDANCYCECESDGESTWLPHDKCGVSWVLNKWCNGTYGGKNPPHAVVKRHNVTIQEGGFTVNTYAGKVISYQCRPHDRGGWVRAPAAPYLVSTSTIEVSPGFVYPTGRIGGNFIVTDKSGKLQIISPSAITAAMPWLTHTLFMAIAMALCGAKIAPILYVAITVTVFESAEAALLPQPAVIMGAANILLDDECGFAGILCAVLLVLFSCQDDVAWLLAIFVKFAMGWRSLAIAGILVGVFLPQNSVTGFKVCVDVHPEKLQIFLDDPSLAYLVITACVCFHLVTLTQKAMAWRRRALYVLTYLHTRLRLLVWVSPLGKGCNVVVRSMRVPAMCMLAISHPKIYFYTFLCVYGAALLADLALLTVEQAILSTTSPTVYNLSRRLECLAKFADERAVELAKAELSKAAACGVFVYKHLGHFSNEVASFLAPFCTTLDPALVTPTKVKIIKDSASNLACGDVLYGLPVCARLGAFVRLGFAPGCLGENWELNAPVAVSEVNCANWLKAFAISISGRQSGVNGGNTWVWGTPLTRMMATGFAGSAYTCYHGSEGRPLAGPNGPTPPITVCPGSDYAIYNLPANGECFDPCACGTCNGYMVTWEGGVRPCKKVDAETYALETAVPLQSVKGSSGGPVVCKLGHLIGITRAVTHRAGLAHTIKIVPVNKLTMVDTTEKAQAAGTPTTVGSAPETPTSGCSVVPYFAPTGSGKSTKLPMHYVSQGKRVLVLNPSVATTLAMPAYMKSAYGISPNCHASDFDITTGSSLTYCTYGKFIAAPHTYTKVADVIICDECHSTDSTTILGIGAVLMTAPNSAVRLVICATATPPGTAWTKHPNIDEIELDYTGEIEFYGRKLPSARYKAGRHLLFCHSKTKCEEVCDDLIANGINAVYYYRGRSLSVITDDPNLCVCATDALMTGYTGNFDTVTDCCMSTEQHASIDLNPTISISLTQVMQPIDRRLQRRGRTGRGKQGTYYYTCKGAHRGGVVPDAAVVQAYDTALAWAGWGADKCTQALNAYKNNAFTPAISIDLGVLESFFALLMPYTRLPEVQIAKEAGSNFDLLTAVQAIECKRSGSGAPSKSGIWLKFGLKYDENRLPPIVARMPDYKDTSAIISPLTRTLQAALGYSFDRASTAAIIGSGLCVSALLVLVSRMGSLCCKSSMRVVAVGAEITAAGIIKLTPPDDALEECVGYEEAFAIAGNAYSKLQQHIEKATPVVLEKGKAAWNAALQLCSNHQLHETILQKTIKWVTKHGSLLAGVGLSMSTMTSLVNNPVLASVMALVGGAVTPASLGIKALCVMLMGAIGSTYAPAESVNCSVASGLIGSLIGATGLQSVLLSLFCGYGSITSAASLMLKIIEGTSWDIMMLADIAALALNPGAAIAGIALAFTIHVLTSSSTTIWVNRLLAMNLKSSVLPEGFFLETSRVREAAIRFVHKLTITSIFREFSDWASRCKDSNCSGTSIIAGVFDAAACLLRWIIGYCQSAFNSVTSFKIPLYSCKKGMSLGAFMGTGDIDTVCECGTRLLYRVCDGVVTPPTTTARTCRNWIMNTVPLSIKTGFTGTVNLNYKAIMCVPREVIVPIGFLGWVKLRKSKESITILASTMLSVTKHQLMNALFRTTPSVIDGIQTSGVYYANTQFVVNDTLVIDNVRVALPLIVELTDDPARDEYLLCQKLSVSPKVSKNPDPYLEPADADPSPPKREPVIGPTSDELVLECAEDAYNLALAHAADTQTLGTASVCITLIMLANERMDKIEAIARALNKWHHSDEVRPRYLYGEWRDFYWWQEGMWEWFIKFVNEHWSTVWHQLSVTSAGLLTAKVVNTLSTLNDWEKHVLIKWSLGITKVPKDANDDSVPKELWISESESSSTTGGDSDEEDDGVEKFEDSQSEWGDTLSQALAQITPPEICFVTDSGWDLLDDMLGFRAKRGVQLNNTKIAILEEDEDTDWSHNSTPKCIILVLSELRWRTTTEELMSKLARRFPDSPIFLVLDVYGRVKAKFSPSRTAKHYIESCVMAQIPVVKAQCVGSRSNYGWSKLQLMLKDYITIPEKQAPFISDCAPESRIGCEEDKEWLEEIAEDAPGPSIFATTPSRAPSVDSLEIPPLEEDPAPEDPSKQDEEEPISYSYIWDRMPNIKKKAQKLLPIASNAVGLMQNRNLISIADPQSVGERMNKVTQWRDPIVSDNFLVDEYNAARSKVSGMQLKEISVFDAIQLVKNKSAKSSITGATPSSLKEKGPNKELLELLSYLRGGKGVPDPRWNTTTLMPKEEIFCKKDEVKDKAPRIIAYPPLETRIAEKVFLNEAITHVPKAVIGEGYGFQYTPNERAKVILKWWEKRKNPMAFAMDTVCFDSNITPLDVEREASIYRCACDESLAEAITLLHNKLYSGGVMLDEDGTRIGYRNCRASGVLTTSASNCLTCYIKSKAAMKSLGINGDLMVCGDDCIVVTESQGPTADAEVLAKLTEKLRQYGLPQDDIITPKYDLECVVSCSMNISYYTPIGKKKPIYYVTRDPSIPLCRASTETLRKDAVNSWIGNLINHFPSPWCRTILLPHLLLMCLIQKIENVTCLLYNNPISLSIFSLPSIIREMHGSSAMEPASFTVRETTRISNVLTLFGMNPLRWWKSKARLVRTKLLLAGGKWAALGRTLLAYTVDQMDSKELNFTADAAKFMEVARKGYSQFDEIGVAPARKQIPWGVVGAMCVFLPVLILLRFIVK